MSAERFIRIMEERMRTATRAAPPDLLACADLYFRDPSRSNGATLLDREDEDFFRQRGIPWTNDRHDNRRMDSLF